jgi:hypothetical protein
LLRGDVLDFRELLPSRVLPVLCLAFLIRKFLSDRRILSACRVQLGHLHRLIALNDRQLAGQFGDLLSKLLGFLSVFGGVGLLGLVLLRGNLPYLSLFLLRRLLPILRLASLQCKLFDQCRILLLRCLHLGRIRRLLALGDGLLIGQYRDLSAKFLDFLLVSQGRSQLDLLLPCGNLLDFSEFLLCGFLPVLRLTLLVVKLSRYRAVPLACGLQLGRLSGAIVFNEGQLADQLGDLLSRLFGFLSVFGGVRLFGSSMLCGTLLYFDESLLGRILPMLRLAFLIGKRFQYRRVLLLRRLQIDGLLTFGGRLLIGQHRDLSAKLVGFLLVIDGRGQLEFLLPCRNLLDFSESLLRRLLPVERLPSLVVQLFGHGRILLGGCLQVGRLLGLVVLDESQLIDRRRDLLLETVGVLETVRGCVLDLALVGSDLFDRAGQVMEESVEGAL